MDVGRNSDVLEKVIGALESIEQPPVKKVKPTSSQNLTTTGSQTTDLSHLAFTNAMPSISSNLNHLASISFEQFAGVLRGVNFGVYKFGE